MLALSQSCAGRRTELRPRSGAVHWFLAYQHTSRWQHSEETGALANGKVIGLQLARVESCTLLSLTLSVLLQGHHAEGSGVMAELHATTEVDNRQLLLFEAWNHTIAWNWNKYCYDSLAQPLIGGAIMDRLVRAELLKQAVSTEK